MSAALGYPSKRINSCDFVPQNRNRSYITNIPILPIHPTDKILGDIIPGTDTGAGWHGVYDKLYESYIQTLSLKRGNMSNCITTWIPTEYRLGTKFYCDGVDILPYTIEDIEKLQGLPIGYTNMPGITEEDRIKMIGNCWTVPVITHILKNLKEEMVYSF